MKELELRNEYYLEVLLLQLFLASLSENYQHGLLFILCSEIRPIEDYTYSIQ